MDDMYVKIYELLAERENFVLATILEKTGSSPREQGTKMIIKRDLSIVGTLGGGIFEAMTIKLSENIFQNRKSMVEKLVLTNERAAALGEACGGESKILLEYMDYNKIADIYAKAAELRKKGIDFVVATKISEEEKVLGDIEKWICTETEFWGKEGNEVQPIFSRIRENFKNMGFQMMTEGQDTYLIESALNNDTVYIFGAGHVSQRIADLTKMLDFRTIVLDDREEFANRDRFKTADEVKVIPSFDNLLNYINVDSRSYIIIVTRGHASDKEVLAQMLKTDAKYIGMIGSRKKRDGIYNTLLNEGYSTKDTERVSCPIGISISAQTPEEIAVSIAAEMISRRRSA